MGAAGAKSNSAAAAGEGGGGGEGGRRRRRGDVKGEGQEALSRWWWLANHNHNPKLKEEKETEEEDDGNGETTHAASKTTARKGVSPSFSFSFYVLQVQHTGGRREMSSVSVVSLFSFPFLLSSIFSSSAFPGLPLVSTHIHTLSRGPQQRQSYTIGRGHDPHPIVSRHAVRNTRVPSLPIVGSVYPSSGM